MCEYEQLLADWKALDPAQVADFVRSAMMENNIPLPEHLIIAGFDEITPQLNCLLKLFHERNIPVQTWPASNDISQAPCNRSLEIRQYANITEEASQCARWVRHIFDSRPEETRSDSTVGIVVPEMSEYRDVLQKELTAELTPKGIFPWENITPRFNISTGVPLAQDPLINIALLLLSIHSNYVPFAIISTILKTPFLSGGEFESRVRHSLELELRSNNLVVVHLESLKDKKDMPQLTRLINSLQKRSLSHKYPSAWAHEISYLLKQNGWPGGDGTLSSFQNQVFEAWKECLDDFASLDNIMGEIPRSHAIEKLIHLAHEKQFNARTGEHPIQVVSLSEAYAMQFDHLWIVGCHAATIPAPPSPNPFIPPHLQKRHNLPHSSAQRELQYAENVLHQMMELSSNIVISFPKQGKNTELQMSPLLKNYSNIKNSFINNVSHRTRDQILTGYSLETWEDPIILPTLNDEISSRQGGYQILKNQSDCPFRAFVKHRLHAGEFNTPEIDFDSSERGKIVHEALCLFWTEVKTKSNLLKLKSNNQYETKLKKCIDKAFKSVSLKIPGQNNFADLECRRIEALLMEWLEKESLRPEFTVKDVEKKVQVQLGELELNIRIDRIDEVTNGNTILIDYKTGKINQKGWFDERLQEIQLPLYAVKIKPSAVGFAEVSKGATGNGFKYLARDNAVMPGFNSIEFSHLCGDWDLLLERWENQLTMLADEFTAGRIEINPFNAPTTCEHCGLKTLCRIEERKPNFDLAEDS